MPFDSYLKKRGIAGSWTLDPQPFKKFDNALVVPSYAEFEQLPGLMESISENEASILTDTLVVIVVNNAENTLDTIRENNLDTLKYLKESTFNYQISYVDCVSEGIALPDKQAGVGLARKIGMDLVLPYLKSSQSLLLCTDADVKLHPDYLLLVNRFFTPETIQAAVVGFSHKSSEDQLIEKGIRSYENFLYSTAEKLRTAGSPYGYVAMGSTMVCRAGAYTAIGGMPRKKATEDFYFLQELAKYAGVYSIPEKLVFPSPRPVSRVYLGTGFRMQQVKEGFNIHSLHYSEDAYALLKEWLKLGSQSWRIALPDLISEIENISPQLLEFLQNEGIVEVWDNLQKTAPTSAHFEKQFHRYFDGLKTLRLLKQFSI